MYANAVAEFIERYRRDGVTEKQDLIDAVDEGEGCGLDANLQTLQLETLAEKDG
ncbi:MAG: hypothetical protein ACI9DC_000057 [Gammaproteobacteria bacterium]